jgi:hypothetical protein
MLSCEAIEKNEQQSELVPPINHAGGGFARWAEEPPQTAEDFQ